MKKSKFLYELKLLIGYIREYGIQHMSFNYSDMNDLMNQMSTDSAKWSEFERMVHKGFYLAQDNVIRLLTKVLKEQKQAKADLKVYRRERDEDKITCTESLLRELHFQECALRKVMDSIVWQFFEYDLSSIRRLYTGNTCIDITDSNLNSEINFVNQYRKEHPDSFVLISDLTSFVQIGDVIIMDKGKLTIGELKEGKVNDEILEILNNYTENHCDYYLSQKLQGKDDKFVKQLKRDVKQIIKASTAYEVLTTGEGIDNNLGNNIKIRRDVIELNDFADTINRLVKESLKKGYGISVIEGFLFLGVYRPKIYPPDAFNMWVESLGIKMPVYDMRASVLSTLAMPLYLQPFSDNTLIDIMSGDIVIKMSFDLDGFLKSLEEDDISVRKIPSRESARINSKMRGSNKIFEYEGMGIELSKNNTSYVISDGIFLRMFANLNTPSSIRRLLKSTFTAAEDDCV